MTLTGIMEIRKPSGKVFTYYRRKGQPLTPLPDLPHDHPDFLRAYADAKASGPKPSRRQPPGSIASLVVACQASARFLALSSGYRALLTRHLDPIRASYGTLAMTGLRDRHISADVRATAAPAHRMRAWRFLCSFGVDSGLMETDPSAGATTPKRPKTIGHPAWTVEDIAAFRARWPLDSAARRCMELLFWTGARISDAAKIGPGMVDADGVLIYRQQKTGSPAYCPWSCDPPAYAAALTADRDLMHKALAMRPKELTFLATTTGRARSVKSLGTLIKEAARAAGIKKSAHGLRKSRARMLAEEGASTHQIAAWTGHKSLSEIQHYTQAADRRRAVMGTAPEHQSANRAG